MGQEDGLAVCGLHHQSHACPACGKPVRFCKRFFFQGSRLRLKENLVAVHLVHLTQQGDTRAFKEVTAVFEHNVVGYAVCIADGAACKGRRYGRAGIVMAAHLKGTADIGNAWEGKRKDSDCHENTAPKYNIALAKDYTAMRPHSVQICVMQTSHGAMARSSSI